jgi:hypothetical protein
MTILKKSEYEPTKITIDLTGPEGNAFALIGLAKNYASQLDIDPEPILKEMKSGDYENLVATFDKYFGEYIDLLR